MTDSRLFGRACLAALAAVAIAACSGPSANAPAGANAADVIYFGGDIVTVDDRQASAEALAVKDGKILAVGTRAEIEARLTGPDTKLVGLKDVGDRAEVKWRRDDVTPLSTSSLAGGKVAYTVAGAAPAGLNLLVFDPADGRTLNSYPLPEADGYPVGVSVGNDRRVVAATSAGQVYSFAPS